MTELAIRQNGNTPALTDEQPQHPGSELVAWAESAVAANNIAQSLAKTSFVPKAFQGKPDEVTAAILAGQEMGLSPMAALRSMHVIQGTAGLSAISLRGLVQAHGHEMWTEESTSTRAIVCGRRKGQAQEERVTWTMDRATKAGFPAKNPNYKTQPQNMLLARATSECARLIAADVLMGMPYSAEELADENDDTAPAPKTRKISRKKTEPAPAPEPEVTPPAPDNGSDEATADSAPQDDEPPLWNDTPTQ
ncbi:hypothetical protein [Streptomyces sp. 891-h]|uniref:hypothetical protein n=1 Tax=Streptomyces sp. 891-h TaxID=2720714 RepID=UPI001FA95935|nr:hypothetical protein [Streptomyces sp. 891-h]UNZ20583.1 hypothetical protein HC362_29500 [Streptomyces sp. 891-h]